MPIGVLRLIVGAFLVIYGLQWLTKAVLRAAGAKGKHDETAIFAAEVAGLTDEPPVATSGMDWISFTVAFKGVLLEGLEVAFIVVTFGASANLLGPAVLGATLAGLLVVAIAVVVHRPLARVPENAMKFVVGVMLTGFGTFWSGEGVGIAWPGDDLAILLLLAGYLAPRPARRVDHPDAGAPAERAERRRRRGSPAVVIRFVRAFLHFWSDFLIGDRLELFIGPIVALARGGDPRARRPLRRARRGRLFAAIVLVGAISLGMATRR